MLHSNRMLILLFPFKNSEDPKITMLGRSSGHIEGTYVGALDESHSWGPRWQPESKPDLWVKTSPHDSIPLTENDEPLNLSWVSRCRRTESSNPCCFLCDFQTHRIYEQHVSHFKLTLDCNYIDQIIITLISHLNC